MAASLHRRVGELTFGDLLPHPQVRPECTLNGGGGACHLGSFSAIFPPRPCSVSCQRRSQAGTRGRETATQAKYDIRTRLSYLVSVPPTTEAHVW